MKIVQINITCNQGSTGKICQAISTLLSKRNIENYIFFTQGKIVNKNSYKIENELYRKFQVLKSRVFGNYGFNANLATKKMIRQIDKIKPNIIHLHNLHSDDVNLKILFNYIKKHNIKVFWTFHDCWMLTGYCTHFTVAKCDKWQFQCENCPQYKKYSWFFDRSRKIFNLKKEITRDIDLNIIAPSKWLAGLVKKSFLKEHPVSVINNGVDLSIFKPTKSNFREKYGLQDKSIVLGVADLWGKNKGLDVFIELSKMLSNKYQIVLVGTNDVIDRIIPKNILSIQRTECQLDLAKIYTASDVFINPTREETFGLVNIEAVACGTPVITFNTGGSPECIDESCGMVVDCNDVTGMYNSIVKVCEEKPFMKENCINRAKLFDHNEKYKEYIKLYTTTV